MDPILELVAITKRYAGVTANNAIDLTLYPGEILALLGENGAGKTTLMNILYGLVRQDSGEIRMGGKVCPISSPKDALRQGIGMVHQHFMLVPTLSVMENIVLGQEPRRGPFLDGRKANEQIARLSEELQLKISPQDKVWQLSVGEQQRVEILKMVYRGARILILDEPTASLTPQETTALFTILRSMTAGGKSVIFISHKLDEVIAISHRIAVLRQGKVMGSKATSEVNESELAHWMVGRDIVLRESKTLPPHVQTRVVASLQDVSVLGNHATKAVDAFSLQLNAGEIVGVTGVDGNGQTELAEALAGLRAICGGKMRIEDQDCAEADPRQRMKLGVAYIPSERKTRGAIPGLSIAMNAILKNHPDSPQSKRGILNQRSIQGFSRQLLSDYDIRCSSIQAKASTLSGGNLQKLILAREISIQPRLLIAEQPTRGLDVGAIENVRQLIFQQRERGAAILYISADLDEILAVSDRIIVLYRGKIVYECPNQAGISRERIGLAMAGMGGGQAQEI